MLHPVDLANYLSDNYANADYASHNELAADTLLDLLAIPARRVNTIELEDHTNLYQALLSMNHAQVDIAFIKNSQSSGAGILTRERIDNFYTIQH